MTLSTQRMRACLQAFDFKRLFIEELGWNQHTTKIAPAEVDGVTYHFAPVAQQGGMVVLTCAASDGNIPPSGARRKIDKHISGFYFEHLILFLDRDAQGAPQTSLWWWVKREDGKTKPRTFTYRRGSSGDALLQRLAGIAFAIEDLDEEGQVSIATVMSRVKKAFDVETVTKKFYDQFKTEHTAFLKFLTGLPDGAPRDWYASVMLNRLMFLYFIQKKRFLNSDPDYLLNKLEQMSGEGKNFYRDFLLILFFEGLACEEGERDDATNRLLGTIPYLNGGLFLPHPLEDQYGAEITIADEAFTRLFEFFEDYTWHLDERPLRKGNEINPDVLGYIFEKYINQKQMGAYYTKEDITGYICRSTILPFLLDKCGVDVRSMMSDVEPYIYEAVASEDYLPTETEREFAARRRRYEQIKADFSAGKITTVDDLVTYNLDIQELVEDWLRTLDDPVTLRRFYFECLTRLTVLDPTCGSGAFLFAAINILEPLYELALDKMLQVVGVPKDAPINPNPRENVVKYLDFVDELKRVEAHPNRRYYVLKRIIVDNLYGVDIMDEAVEICKLRLFLKMVAQVEDPARIEPLPDIDFNIRAGNTLVGFATKAEIKPPLTQGFRLYDADKLLKKVEDVDRSLDNFRELQTRIGVESNIFKSSKARIQAQLAEIRADLDRSLMDDYGKTDLDAFRASHKPFHWYVEFNSVLSNGGFDVIVGNPPYVEYSKVRKEYAIRNYQTESSGNLYAFTLERAINLARSTGRYGLIVPMSFVSTERVGSVRGLLLQKSSMFWVSNYSGDAHPAVLFDGVKMRLSIVIGQRSSSMESPKKLFSTRFQRWYSEARENLFESISYQTVSDRLLLNGLIPKLGSSIEADILAKLYAQRRRLGHFVMSSSDHSIYAHRIVAHFIKAFDFVPHFWNEKDGTKRSEDYKVFAFRSAAEAMLAAAVLNSTTFYYFYLLYSDAYHCGRELILAFPLDLSSVDGNLAKRLRELNRELMEDMESNARRRRIEYRTGWIEYDEFYPRLSKPIIDEIDRVLAKHYGFTEEELDFIIHYDIKYRMGRDAEADGGDE